MPSSSAFVAAMPSSRPLDELELERAPFLGQVAGAVRGDPVGELGRDAGEPAPRVLRHDLGAAPAAGERERLVARRARSGS